MNVSESQTSWRAHRAALEARGFHAPEVVGYATDEMKRDYRLAMDAMPTLSTTASGSLPALFTSYVDPDVVRIVFAPVEAANIASEKKTADWLADTAFFPVVESTGEVSSYDDFAQNGRAGINTTFPQRQSYHFQVMKEWGEREAERYGLARLNYASEVDRAAAENLNRFLNYSYFFGMGGLQLYGLVNDPNLTASLTPTGKAYGGVRWINSGVIVASANEIFLDIQSAFYQLVAQTAGLVKAKDKLVLAMSPGSAVALTATNSFGVDVYKLLEQNFPNIRHETAVQYGAANSTNPQGVAAGNMIHLFAETVDGKKTVYCSFTEKMRAHRLETYTSSWKQKVTSGTWGAIWRYPLASTTMVGV